MKKPGYREMLRDRCPKVVDYALKWQKAKDAWIEHVYHNFIGIYVAKDNRNNATRIALGIVDGKIKNFEFDKTINWDDLTDEETTYWKRVSSWVEWFRTNYAYIENMYDTSKKVGKDEEDIKIEIIIHWLGWLMPDKDNTEEESQAKYQYIDKLVDYLIKCFERKI